jgi:hypothetical protein
MFLFKVLNFLDVGVSFVGLRLHLYLPFKTYALNLIRLQKAHLFLDRPTHLLPLELYSKAILRILDPLVLYKWSPYRFL